MTRIVSFLPAGTEIAFALGAGPQLVGRSHECDYPPEVLRLPIVSRPALDLDGLTPGEMDRAVTARLQGGESLYQVDEHLLRELSPDVILTQDLCQVCAPSGNELSRAVRDLPGSPQLIWLSPQTLRGIEENILAVGEATNTLSAAEALVKGNRDRINRVRSAVKSAPVRRVAFLEWFDPIFAAGHWVPEMIELAGGKDPLGKSGSDSERVGLEQVQNATPEIVIFAPCGYRLEKAVELGRRLPGFPGATIYAVDANGYFARPGPRVAEGVELLAHLFHPESFAWPHRTRPWQSLGNAYIR